MHRIGVDVGGTFTDLVAWDGSRLRVVKVPSTPPRHDQGVIHAVARVGSADNSELIHGSTVATNALLQRAGAPIAFVTTEGFGDMLLIGRQNRPKLYALRVRRSPPLAPPENCFTVQERIDPQGSIVVPLDDAEVDRVIEQIRARGIEHVAVCLLFSFVNPIHERRIGDRCERAGLTVNLSSDVLREFREYERASTTAINASLRPVVAGYLQSLERGLGQAGKHLRIMHSGGGTMRAHDAARQAARLVLSGPAGGVIGAAYVARLAGFQHCITYDMGGTSTDVAVIRDGHPQWTTQTTIDGLPIGLPMFDIHTVGAGGGSIASLDTGGAMRVGPRSAGAVPGPACYARAGTEPTVTDANVVLRRILPDRFLGGAMHLDVDAAHRALERLAVSIGKNVIDTAHGILAVAENNMAQAIRAVSSRRGHDPKDSCLVSFGGAGGLHACALAEALGIESVLIPPHCGVLSALGMVVAPAIIDVSRTVLQDSDRLDDDAIARHLAAMRDQVPGELLDGATIEWLADVRFEGQSHEVLVAFDAPRRDALVARFEAEYQRLYRRVPQGRRAQIVTLRARARGPQPDLELAAEPGSILDMSVELFDESGNLRRARAISRATLDGAVEISGPVLLIDPDATAYIPAGWSIAAARGLAGGLVARQIR